MDLKDISNSNFNSSVFSSKQLFSRGSTSCVSTLNPDPEMHIHQEWVGGGFFGAWLQQQVELQVGWEMTVMWVVAGLISP